MDWLLASSRIRWLGICSSCGCRRTLDPLKDKFPPRTILCGGAVNRIAHIG
jgi:hypothetical protein